MMLETFYFDKKKFHTNNNDIHKMFVSHPARMNEFRFTYLHVPHRFKMYFLY